MDITLIFLSNRSQFSLTGTETLQGHANKHFAYPPQSDHHKVDKHLLQLLYQYSTSAEPFGVITLTQHIDEGGS